MSRLFNLFSFSIFVVVLTFSNKGFSESENFHYSEVKNLILNLEIMNLLSGFSSVDAVQQMKAMIQDEYGYPVSCQSSFFRSLKVEFCLAGMVTMYRALRLELMDENPYTLGVTEVIIGRQESWKNANWRNEEVSVYIPYDATIFDMTQFVNFQYEIPFRGKLLSRLDLIEKSLDEIEKRFGISVLVGEENYSINEILYFLRSLEIALPHLDSEHCDYKGLDEIKEIVIDEHSSVLSRNAQGNLEKIAIVYTMRPDKLCKVIQSID